MPLPVHVRRRLRLAAATALLLAGCTTTTPGSGVPDAGSGAPGTSERPPSAGPLDELLGQRVLSDDLADGLVPEDIAALPDGGAVALVRRGGRDTPAPVVELLPGPSGLELGDVREIPQVPSFADLLVTPDGTVVVPDQGYSRDDEQGYRLTVLEPGSTVPDERVLSDQPESGGSGPAGLSADGRTLYAGFSSGDDDVRSSLVAIDVDTAEVLTSREVELGVPPLSGVQQLVVRPDGGVSAAVLVASSPESEDLRSAYPVLAEFDEDLQLVGEPVDLVPDGETGRTRGLALMSDGAVLVSIIAGDEDGLTARMLLVRDGEVERTYELADVVEAPSWFALDPDERYAYLAYGGLDEQIAVGTLDLESGEVVAEVPLCPAVDADILPPLLALDADGSAVTVVSTCVDNGEVHAFRVG